MTFSELIGNTPLVELQNIPVNKDVTILGKLEGNNPGGSVKDRAALGMISAALERKTIKPGDNSRSQPGNRNRAGKLQRSRV